MAKLFKIDFLSLKWKVGLGFGLVLLALNSIFPALVLSMLKQQLETTLKNEKQLYLQELTSQNNQLSKQNRKLINLLLAQNSSVSQTEVIDTLTKNKVLLEHSWNISQLHYIDSDFSDLGGWGLALPDNILNQIANTVDDRFFISCAQQCQQFDIILGNDVTIVLVSDLTSLIQDIERKFDILVTVLPTTQSSHIADITHQENKVIETSFLTLQSLPITIFSIKKDITQQYLTVLNTSYKSVFISLFIIAVIAFFLLLYLSNNLVRLKSISQALALLSRQKYESAKLIISNKPHNNKLPDEFDILESTTYELISQLEHMEVVLHHNTDILNERNIDLQQERDFIKKLFDTTPLIIITSDNNFNILSLNSFAEETTGLQESTVLNSSLSRFFPQSDWSKINSELKELSNKSHHILEQEYEFINNNEQARIISWLHSSLMDPSSHKTILSVGIDITDKKHSEERIIWMADHDALTSLYNRRRFNAEFTNVLATSQRFEHQSSLLFLDLDHFKDLNDSCGHTEGDKLLIKVSQTLLDLTRSTDIVARLGGDEFALLLPKTDELGTIKVAESICKAIENISIIHNKIQYKVTVSIGFITFPQSNLSIEELIINADLAMYQAKDKGKNRWHQFSLNDHARERLKSRLLWKSKIEKALSDERFIFYYQPIMDIKSRTVSHYEMLIRMENEDGSISFPDSFIPIAEQTGLIQSIDHYVLHRGILKQEELDLNNESVSLAMNLSGSAFTDPVLLALQKHFITQSNVNPEHLIFEITETSAVADIKQARIMMEPLKELGCRFSIDDFGTGFASFRYMRDLPIDIVKIDGSFIKHLVTSNDDQLFVKALVDVAKGMGKKTVAEFVENAETLKLLEEFGVDYAQGYYIGKPEPELLDGPPVLK